MTKTASGNEFSRPISAASLSAGGTRLEIEATPAERERLARRLNVLSVDSLRADLCVFSYNSGIIIKLSGKFVANLVQACVITLEPVKAHIEATVERIYSVEEKADDATEIDVAPDDAEPLEPLIGGVFDAGEAVTEQLALELNPFPRSPNAEFMGYASGGSDDKTGQAHPFAVLAKLKRDSK